tara:strand:- start:1735 stop:2073 length:339 start_codon:yes stop_codon:yes gene_type:complete
MSIIEEVIVRCPICKSPTSVVDSRPQSLAVKRRRKCDGLFVKCNHRFNTLEITEVSYNGSTPDSKPVNVGSIPTASAKNKVNPKRKSLPYSDPIFDESLTDDELEALITGEN